MHRPVMVREATAFLAPAPGFRFLDCTLGGGGHAAALLASAPDVAVWGIDRDAEALARAGKALAPFAGRFHPLHGNFADAGRLLPEEARGRLDGILADLGVSSDQLEDPARGFGFSREGPLDMRMDPRGGTTAAELLAEAPEEEIADLLFRHGGERRSRRIARRIVAERRRDPIRTTAQLARIVERALGGRRGSRIHPATRTFQALRIAVNEELASLERALPAWLGLLRAGGRLVVISFHSGEDRIVKRAFLSWAREGRSTVLTKKPARPSPEEAADNPRARSAKLRAAERR